MSGRHDRTDLQLEKERCFLVGAIVPGRYDGAEEPLAELERLVDTAGGRAVGRITQRLDRPHPKTFLGTGRFEELVETARGLHADTIVVDDDLSPRQLSTIENACRTKVIDRSEVILDIFAGRARSYQAKLQVALAQMEYELPRLARKWLHLERLGGGIGTRGPGESQIESDRRIIRSRIASLREELREIEARKAREVTSRASAFTACLVGYTNAGKSTLLNRLTGAEALVEDRLFATLDTLTRRLDYPEEGLSVLVSDTVGFIRRLPHHLVASFHATLEEAEQADLLIHVVDGSDPMALRFAEAAEGTLGELGMAHKPRLYALNKTDAVADPAALERLGEALRPSVRVSALSGTGLPELRAAIAGRALQGRKEVTLRFPAADGRRFALVNEIGEVRGTRYDNADAVVTVSLDTAALERIRRLPGSMEELPAGA